MELRDAISQISQIRMQMARAEKFRGLRAIPVAFSGVLALVAGFAQIAWVELPATEIRPYLTIWLGASCRVSAMSSAS